MVFIGPKEMFLAAKILERQFDSRSHITIGKTKKSGSIGVCERDAARISEFLRSLMSRLFRACSHQRTTLISTLYHSDRRSVSVSLASMLENWSRTHLIAPTLSLKHSFKGPFTRNIYVCIFLWSLPYNPWKYTCLVWIPDTGVTCERRT